MRVAFANKRLEELDRNRRSKHYSEQIAKMYLRRMHVLRSVDSVDDLHALQSLGFHQLKGDRAGQYAIKLTGNWRLIVELREDERGQRLLIVDIVDYH